MPRRDDLLLETLVPLSADPIMLATWSSGQTALAAAWDDLANGGSALDAVVSGCRFAEADLTNQTVGVGGLPDRDGRVSLDAAVMLSPARSGAVCAVRRALYPISVARQVMEQTPHNLLAGGDADHFAVEQGMQTGELLTSAAKKQWEQWRSSEASSNPIANIEEIRAENHDTIGVLALDRQGTVAAGCSTSGLSWKLPGRVGDSPIIGQGLYTDPALGACVCTGHGELVAGICGAFLAIEILRRGGSPEDACAEVMNRLTKSYRLHEQDQVGMIVLARSGKFATASLRPGYKTAIRTADREEIIEPGLVVYK